MNTKFCSLLLPAAVLLSGSIATIYAQDQGHGGTAIIEPGMPPVVLHGTVEASIHAGQRSKPGGGSASKNLYYHGGTPDGGTTAIGVETAPKVYLVLWGSQWTNNDPSGEANILQNFYSNVGGSSWLNSVTQYCQGVNTGAYSCGTTQLAGNPSNIFAGVWADNALAAPSRPSQSQLASEALNAASHFGNTKTDSNVSVQYVIATAHGYSASGFGVQYCAWHSSTSSATAGHVAYTNLPYITDAGASCGANFNGLSATAGITIVGGHELAETITDQFPSSGWLDSAGAENGDKCAWITTGNDGASANVSLNDTTSYPVQSLWSNAANGGAGGCVMSY